MIRKVHYAERKSLFTPMQTKELSHEKGDYTGERTTEGIYSSSGKCFVIHDNWLDSDQPHEVLKDKWVGTTYLRRRRKDAEPPPPVPPPAPPPPKDPPRPPPPPAGESADADAAKRRAEKMGDVPEPAEDYWVKDGLGWTRVHVTPRTLFYTPPTEATPDGPQRKDITWDRITEVRDIGASSRSLRMTGLSIAPTNGGHIGPA